jgi:thiol:disulfide interchange protein
MFMEVIFIKTDITRNSNSKAEVLKHFHLVKEPLIPDCEKSDQEIIILKYCLK